MTDMERKTFCAALSRYGAQAQITMAFEEMAELQDVLCNTCHARGGAVGGRVMNDPWTRCAQLPDWATTDKTLEAKAIEAWNRRANDDTN